MQLNPNSPDFASLWQDAGPPTWAEALARVHSQERADLIAMLDQLGVDHSTEAALNAARADRHIMAQLRGRQMRDARRLMSPKTERFDGNGLVAAHALAEREVARQLHDARVTPSTGTR